jgi:hypothetical protein
LMDEDVNCMLVLIEVFRFPTKPWWSCEPRS